MDYDTADDKNADDARDMVVAKENIPLKNVRAAYHLTGAAALILALFLVLQTSFILYFIGFGGMLIGILYTFGPLPISSTPFGEFFIGLAYGFSIFASMVYVNAFDVISFDWIMGRNNQMLTAQLGPVLCLDCPAVLGYLEGPRLIVDTSAIFFDLI